MPVPQDGTVALEQLGGTPAGMKTPHMTVSSTTATRIPSQPHSATTTTPIELILTGDNRCNYVSPNGEPCKTNMASKKNSTVARHWLECHAIKELKAVRSRKLPMSRATIINTVAKKLVAERYIATCPLKTCLRKGTSRAIFPRKDTYSLVRHMSSSRLHMDMPMSRARAEEWALTNLAIQTTSNEFASVYEEAVWRICHGY